MRPIFLAILLLAVTACETVDQPPYPPVPPLRAEAMAKPPVTETLLIWQPGYWDWNGAGYEWKPGQFVARDGHGGNWMPSYWQKTDRGWNWARAHWVP